MNNWKTIIEKNKKLLESTILLQSYGYHAGDNHGFVVSIERLNYKNSPETLLNQLLEIIARRLYPYKSSKQYSKVSVSISASGNGVYINFE